jgi:N-acetylglucosamine repressor
MVIKANHTKVVKEANKFLVLNCIREYEPTSQEEIVTKTRLSRPTVINIVKELLEENLIEKTGYGESNGGRSPVLLSFNSTAYYALGIDSEFPTIRMAISDLKGNIIHNIQWRFPLDVTTSTAIESLMGNIEKLITDSKVEKEKIMGIGIGLPGIIDVHNGISVSIERINDWKHVPIQKIIEEHFDIPVYIRNDVHLLALAEKNINPMNKHDSFIYIGIRSGIGMSIIMNGSLFEGETGNSGFLGHMTVDVNGAPCICGSKGCLEAVAGELAMARKYIQLIGQDEKASTEIVVLEEITLNRLSELARMGDGTAKRILEESGIYMGIGIANVMKLFEIPSVVIGPYKDQEETMFIDFIRNEVDKRTFENIKGSLSIVNGKMTNEELFPLGGCFLVIEQFYQEPKLQLFM